MYMYVYIYIYIYIYIYERRLPRAQLELGDWRWRGTEGVPRKGVWTSVDLRVWTRREVRVNNDQTGCYLRPLFLGTPLVPSRWWARRCCCRSWALGEAPEICLAPNLPTKIIPTKIAWLKNSSKFPMDMGIPPLTSKILLESNPLKSGVLVLRLAVPRWEGQASGMLGSSGEVRHRLNGYVAQRVPCLFLASSFKLRNCLDSAVLKCMFAWRTRYPLS